MAKPFKINTYKKVGGGGRSGPFVQYPLSSVDDPVAFGAHSKLLCTAGC
jgi:hypothetical protein